MSILVIGEKQENFIEMLLRLINERQSDEAITQILKLPSQVERLEILEQLAANSDTDARNLRVNLIAGLSFARTFDHDISFDLLNKLALDMTRSLSIARVGVPALALTLARSFELVNNLAFELDHDRALALALARALARASPRLANLGFDGNTLVVIVELIISSLSDILDFDPIQTWIDDIYSRQLANSLDESIYLQRKTGSAVINVITIVLDQIIGGNLRHITLEGIKVITPTVLEYEIAPFLQAIGDIQEVYNALYPSINNHAPRIVSMHNEAPKFEITDAGKAIKDINDVVTPKIRKDTAEQRSLQNENIALQNEALRLQNERTNEKIAASRRRQQIEDDPQLTYEQKNAQVIALREESRQKKLENDERELALEERRWQLERARMHEYFDIAAELLERFKPSDVSLDDLATHLPKLAAAVQTMWESNLTMRIGWHDNPRPPTLPEEDRLE